MKTEQTIKQTLADFKLPSYEEIPDIGLYLDQVVKYINGYFEAFPEMQVTASMLTNYVKQKLVKRVNKKTYVRDQIAIFFFIAMSKSVLSIDNIRLYLNQQNQDSFEETYQSFCKYLKEIFASMKSGSTNKHNEEMLYYIANAIAHKMYLERIFTESK